MDPHDTHPRQLVENQRHLIPNRTFVSRRSGKNRLLLFWRVPHASDRKHMEDGDRWMGLKPKDPPLRGANARRSPRTWYSHEAVRGLLTQVYPIVGPGPRVLATVESMNRNFTTVLAHGVLAHGDVGAFATETLSGLSADRQKGP
jgi:hypothetical protein